MPDFEDVLEWLEEAFDWIGLFANDVVLGLVVALGLMLWIWKGRDSGAHPA